MRKKLTRSFLHPHLVLPHLGHLGDVPVESFPEFLVEKVDLGPRGDQGRVEVEKLEQASGSTLLGADDDDARRFLLPMKFRIL